MPRVVKIKLSSNRLENLIDVCNEIMRIAEKTGVRAKGPIPLPTKRLLVVTRKAPSGQGSHTFDKWEMRIHRRLIYVDADEKMMKMLTMIRVPDDVKMEAFYI